MKIYDPKTNTVNWNVLKTYPEIARLEKTPQNEIWHKEGNAYIHTCMVTTAMLKYIESGHPFISWITLLSNELKEILVLSAILHDIGKPVVTKKGSDGLYHSKNHAIEGAKIARVFLNEYFKDDPLSNYKITAICNMIRYHMQPLYILNKSNIKQRLVKLANNLDYVFFDLLLLLKWCDCEGSLYDEEDHYQSILNNVRNRYYDEVSYKSGDIVLLEKVGDSDTCKYTPGNHPNGINTGYTISGILYTPITLGIRCFVSFDRYLSTSPVKKIIDKNTFETKNSIYKITKINN